MMKNASPPSGGRILRAVTALLWCALIVFILLHRDEITVESILHYTPRSPVLAGIVMLALFVIKSLTFVFYSGILYMADGMLFPLPIAILLNICGTIAMVLAPYLLARRLGSDCAASLRNKYPKLKAAEALRRSNDLAFVTLLRSVKLVNFDLGSMYLGAVRITLPHALLGSVLGMSVDIILFPIIGGNLSNPHAAAFWLALGLDLLVSLMTIFISKAVAKKERDTT